MTGGPLDKDSSTTWEGVRPDQWLNKYKDSIQTSREKLKFKPGSTLDDKIKTTSEVIGEIATVGLNLNKDIILEKEPKEKLEKGVNTLNNSLKNNIMSGLTSLRQIADIKSKINTNNEDLNKERQELLDRAYTLIENNLNEFVLNNDFYELRSVIDSIMKFQELKFDDPLMILRNHLDREFSTTIKLENTQDLVTILNKFKNCLANLEVKPEPGESYRDKSVKDRANTYRPDTKIIYNIMNTFVRNHNKDISTVTYFEILQVKEELKELAEFIDNNRDLITSSDENFYFQAKNLVDFFDNLIEEIKNKSS